jgi:hypothetical protein
MNTYQKNAYKDMAVRITNAENRFIDWAVEISGCSITQAEKVLKVYKKAKAVKIDKIGGQFRLTHGGFAEPDVIWRAINDC